MAGLRIEPNIYHLSPHIDVHAKIVTWQFSHPHSFELGHRKVGTMFYRPKADLRTLKMNDKADPPWLDFEHFEPVREQPVVPNHLFAFAPNTGSWHGAKIEPDQLEGVANRFARRTFLGFITDPVQGLHFFSQNDYTHPNPSLSESGLLAAVCPAPCASCVTVAPRLCGRSAVRTAVYMPPGSGASAVVGRARGGAEARAPLPEAEASRWRCAGAARGAGVANGTMARSSVPGALVPAAPVCL